MIIVASKNEGKIREIGKLESAEGLELVSIASFDGCPDIPEEGTTFEENAAIKAVKYSLWLKREHGIWPCVIAEDSGLSVEGLLGWPGIHSARIAETDEDRINAVLEKMAELASRSASFVAVTALAVNGTLIRTFSGQVQGSIADGPSGTGGFGYDPIFIEPTSGRTFAEIGAEAKNSISHRAKSWSKMFDYLRKRQAALVGEAHQAG